VVKVTQRPPARLSPQPIKLTKGGCIGDRSLYNGEGHHFENENRHLPFLMY